MNFVKKIFLGCLFLAMYNNGFAAVKAQKIHLSVGYGVHHSFIDVSGTANVKNLIEIFAAKFKIPGEILPNLQLVVQGCYVSNNESLAEVVARTFENYKTFNSLQAFILPAGVKNKSDIAERLTFAVTFGYYCVEVMLPNYATVGDLIFCVSSEYYGDTEYYGYNNLPEHVLKAGGSVLDKNEDLSSVFKRFTQERFVFNNGKIYVELVKKPN